MTAGVTVRRLGHLGDGVADGPLYAARTLPGEVVAGEVVDDRIPAPRILTPSPSRVAAPCPHFRRCGGCALQHASDGFVAAWKVDRVRAALARRGIEAEVALAHVSPPGTRRRAGLSGRRTKKGATVGFRAAGSHEVVAIPDCRLLHPDLMAALPALGRLTRAVAPRGGTVRLHATATETGVDLAVEGAKALVPGDVAPFADAFARIVIDGEPAVMAARPMLRLAGAPVAPPPGAFLQATAEGEDALQAAVAAILGGAGHVADLFAGLGTFALRLARAARVTAFEGDAALVAALAAVAPAAGSRPVEARRRDLFRDPLSADELSAFDGVVIDPPRAGAAAQVATLARADVGRVAFVACDPSTFARDAATLVAAGWRMGAVAVIDQFRWSPHVEVVAGFARG